MDRGQLDIIAGGRLETFGGTISPSLSYPAIAVISGPGSTWNLKSQPLFLGLDRRGDSGGSVSVRVENGGQLLGSEIFVRYNGILSGDGLIVGRVRNGGTIRPGRSPGKLTIQGDFAQEDVGILDMEIGGVVGGVEYDQVVVGGSAALDGELLLSFVNGFAPRRGQQFALLDVGGSISGEFATSRYQGLMPGFEYRLAGDGDQLTLIALNDAVAIPEPASAVLGGVIALTATLAALHRRWKLRRSATLPWHSAKESN